MLSLPHNFMFGNDRDYTKPTQPSVKSTEEKISEPSNLSESIAKLTVWDVFKLSFFGVLVGCFIVYFTCKWTWGNTLENIKFNNDFNYLMKSVVPIPIDVVDPANNGKIVLVNGVLESSDILQDKHFGVSAQALQLVRLVEVYQKVTVGAGKTARTDVKWNERLYSNDGNPSKKDYGTQVVYANELKIGQFKILPEVLSKINTEGKGYYYNSRDYKLLDNNFKTNNNPPIEDVVKGELDLFYIHNKYTNFPLSQSNYDAIDENLKGKIKLVGEVYANGDLSSPNIGDYRIRYLVMNAIEVTMIGVQNNDSLDFLKIGDDYYKMIRTGKHTVQEMMRFEEKKLDTGFYTANFFQWLFLSFGIFLVLNPFRVLKNNNSFIGRVTRIGILPIAISLSLLIVGSASFLN